MLVPLEDAVQPTGGVDFGIHRSGQKAGWHLTFKFGSRIKDMKLIQKAMPKKLFNSQEPVTSHTSTAATPRDPSSTCSKPGRGKLL